MVELVRDLRSSYGYIDGDFKTFVIDIGSEEYDAFFLMKGATRGETRTCGFGHVTESNGRIVWRFFAPEGSHEGRDADVRVWPCNRK